MSTYELCAIRAADVGIYELEFGSAAGEAVLVRCAVSVRDGITSFDPVPDLFMPGLVRVREVSAAIRAFDKAVRSEVTEC